MRASFSIVAIVAAASLGLAACTATVADRKALAAGFTRYQARDFDAAEAAASAYLAKYPAADNADEALYLRGLARVGRGDRGGATPDFTAAIARTRRPDLKAKAWRALGDIAFDASNWPEAVKDYQFALTGPAGGPSAYLNFRIGCALQAQGQWVRAKPFLDKAAASGEAPYAASAAERAAAQYFTLQFGSFSDPGNANNLARELQAAGTSAGVFPVTHDGRPIYAVRAGGYATWSAAESARAKVQARYPVAVIYP